MVRIKRKPEIRCPSSRSISATTTRRVAFPVCLLWNSSVVHKDARKQFKIQAAIVKMIQEVLLLLVLVALLIKIIKRPSNFPPGKPLPISFFSLKTYTTAHVLVHSEKVLIVHLYTFPLKVLIHPQCPTLAFKQV